jgi:hypothetical protein
MEEAMARATHGGRTLLYVAARMGCAETVQALLARGANPNARSSARTDSMPLHGATYYARDEVVSALLADPRTRILCTNQRGEAPLHNAYSRGDRRLMGKIALAIQREATAAAAAAAAATTAAAAGSGGAAVAAAPGRGSGGGVEQQQEPLAVGGEAAPGGGGAGERGGAPGVGAAALKFVAKNL